MNYPPVPAWTQYPTHDRSLTAPQENLGFATLRCLGSKWTKTYSPKLVVFLMMICYGTIRHKKKDPSQRVTLPENFTVRLPLKIRPKPPKERIIHSNHWIFWFWTYAVFWFWVQLFFQPFFLNGMEPKSGWDIHISCWKVKKDITFGHNFCVRCCSNNKINNKLPLKNNKQNIVSKCVWRIYMVSLGWFTTAEHLKNHVD